MLTQWDMESLNHAEENKTNVHKAKTTAHLSLREQFKTIQNQARLEAIGRNHSTLCKL